MRGPMDPAQHYTPKILFLKKNVEHFPGIYYWRYTFNSYELLNSFHGKHRNNFQYLIGISNVYLAKRYFYM